MSRRRYDDEDERPRSRRRYDDDRDSRDRSEPEDRPRRRKSNKLPYIIGGAALLFLLIAVIIIVVATSGKNSAKATVENFQKIKPGQTLEEVEKILGRGSSCSPLEIRDAYAGAFNEVHAAFELASAQSTQSEKYYVWRGNDITIFVGFGKGASGLRSRRVFESPAETQARATRRDRGVQLSPFGDNLDQVAEKRKSGGENHQRPKMEKG